MGSPSSQASNARRLTTTGTVALTVATAPTFAAPRPVQDPRDFIVSPTRTQISFTHCLKCPGFCS
ncbi:hypothetical protein ACOJAM_06865 [Corynebacterium striatum]|uniref:hypothetical protein n=1 Tax=Corynebacterium striatum TaxID=43770 RepID=UPI001A209DFC|nr:hypothetical protein [Corynebacterium striatum]